MNVVVPKMHFTTDTDKTLSVTLLALFAMSKSADMPNVDCILILVRSQKLAKTTRYGDAFNSVGKNRTTEK